MSSIISSAIINNTNEPATANDWISTLKRCIILSPRNKNIIIIPKATHDVLIGFISIPFDFKLSIKGMEPVISIIAKSVMKARESSLKLIVPI